jgi:fatty acid desaturase
VNLEDSRDPRLSSVAWQDLLVLSGRERLWELTLPLPWLAGSLAAYASGWWWLGGIGSFFFFLTGLRLSHHAQHRSLGIGRGAHDLVLFLLSLAMVASMHAVQVTHLHHHRHTLEADDIEAAYVHLAWWRVLLMGAAFPVKLHRSAWRLAASGKRGWICAEVGAILAWLAAAWFVLDVACLRWHATAMAIGECFTGFFCVWTVHHGCDARGQVARTQRGWLMNFVSYSMFYHLEHHLYPAVPTCHLPVLAERLDRAAPELREMAVF